MVSYRAAERIREMSGVYGAHSMGFQLLVVKIYGKPQSIYNQSLVEQICRCKRTVFAVVLSLAKITTFWLGLGKAVTSTFPACQIYFR